MDLYIPSNKEISFSIWIVNLIDRCRVREEIYRAILEQYEFEESIEDSEGNWIEKDYCIKSIYEYTYSENNPLIVEKHILYIERVFSQVYLLNLIETYIYESLTLGYIEFTKNIAAYCVFYECELSQFNQVPFYDELEQEYERLIKQLDTFIN